MKKLVLVLTVLSAAFVSSAQTGKNEIGVGADLGLPTGDFKKAYKLGFGGYVKGLYGIGSAGQITLTTGYTTYSAKSEVLDAMEVDKMKVGIIPILAGYRHNFDGFYAEPAIGYGILRNKFKSEQFDIDLSESTGAFTWSLGAGYVVNKFDIGLRYQSSSKDGSTFGLFGLRIGYNFSLAK